MRIEKKLRQKWKGVTEVGENRLRFISVDYLMCAPSNSQVQSGLATAEREKEEK